MGISADQFWQTSANGKAMVLFLANNQYIELVRDILEWLVVQYEKDLQAAALQKGATAAQAKTVAQNSASQVLQMAQSCNDRNATGVATTVIDQVFQRHYNAGKGAYDKAMLWFANELRKKVRD